MKSKINYLALLLFLAIPTIASAGSDRLIMGLSLDTVQARQLVHVKFIDSGDGSAVSSQLLKEGRVMLDGCNTTPLILGVDYKYGYYPKPKKVGIYLPPKVWRGHQVCISLPGYKPIKEQFDDNSITHSLDRVVTKL